MSFLLQRTRSLLPAFDSLCYALVATKAYRASLSVVANRPRSVVIRTLVQFTYAAWSSLGLSCGA